MPNAFLAHTREPLYFYFLARLKAEKYHMSIDSTDLQHVRFEVVMPQVNKMHFERSVIMQFYRS